MKKKLDKDMNVRSKDDTEIDVGMNDAEIVKRLEWCVQRRENCCLDCGLENPPCDDDNFIVLILDIIHRLQREKAEYERKLSDGELVSKDWHDEQVGHAELVIEEQKSEIERLEKRNSILLYENDAMEAQCIGFQKQVDELKQAKNNALDIISQGEQQILQIRKDTAKEIFTDIDKAFSLYYPHGQIPYSVFQDVIKQLAKKKCVEVE